MTNTQIDGKEKQNGMILQAMDDGAKINIFVNFTELNESASFNIYKKSYNEEAGEYEENAEVFQGALEKLEQLGVDPSELEQYKEEQIADLQDIADGLIMKDVELYFNGERASFEPIKAFQRFDPITAGIAKSLKQAVKNSTVFKTLPIIDYEKGLRFNILLTGEFDGEKKNIRISQFLDDEEVKHSVKYRDKQIDNFLEQLEQDKVNENVKDQFKKSVDQLISRNRKNKVEELSNLLGVEDLDEAIDNEQPFYVRVEEVNTVGSTSDPAYFIVTSLATEGEFNEQ